VEIDEKICLIEIEHSKVLMEMRRFALIGGSKILMEIGQAV
jgi:hypothetical protein